MERHSFQTHESIRASTQQVRLNSVSSSKTGPSKRSPCTALSSRSLYNITTKHKGVHHRQRLVGADRGRNALTMNFVAQHEGTVRGSRLVGADRASDISTHA